MTNRTNPFKFHQQNRLPLHFTPKTGIFVETNTYSTLNLSKMFSKANLWIALFAIFTTFVLRAENEPTIEYITTKNGLSHNNVHSLLQDKTGFIWLGTMNGLNRYDGVRMKNLSAKKEYASFLSNSNINMLYQDNNGYIWVKTYADVMHCYDPVKEHFIPLNTGNEASPVKGKLLYEDKRGNIWLSSPESGCVSISFNQGKISKSFYSTSQKINHIPSDYIFDIFEDSQHNIWLLTENGLAKVVNNRITYTRLPRIKDNTYFKAFEFNHRIFFVTKGGNIEIYNLQKQSFDKPVPLDLPGRVIKTAQVGKDRILISTNTAGLFIYNALTGQYTPGEKVFGEKILNNPNIQTDPSGGIWVSNLSGNVWMLNPDNGKVVKMNLIPSSVLQRIDSERYHFVCDSKGNVWISTYGNGLFCYHKTTGKLRHYTYCKHYANRLASNFLQSIMLDKDENIWVGTANVGLNKLTFPDQHVKSIYPDTESEDESGNDIRALLEDRNRNVWVSSKAGYLYRYDPTLTQKTILIKDGPYIFCMYQDKTGSVWLGTKGKGLIELKNGNIQQSVKYLHSKRAGSLSNDQVFSMLQDRKGRLWVATFGNGICVKTTAQGTEGFRTFFDGQSLLSFTRYLLLDRNGDIWAGTSNGVLRFNPDALLRNPGAYKYYTTEPGNPRSLSNPKIHYIFQDSKGRIWLGTSGGGLNRFEGETPNGKGIFKAFTTQQSMAGNNIMAIQEDTSGDLWISTENGFYRFNPQTGLFHASDLSRELTSNIFAETSAYTCRNGRILWGSLNGFYAFFPKEMTKGALHSDKVTLTGLSIFDEEAKVGETKAPLKQSISLADKVVLKAGDKVFHIEFANLNFKIPGTNQYMYMLENYEKRWNISGAYSVATYRNVPPGKYIFKVKMVDSEGNSNNQVTSIVIIIQPPFWLTWWAFVIYIILLATAGYFAFRVITKIQRLNTAVKMERQLTEYKLHFFTNISHEFRTPLTLIKGSVDTLKELKAKMAEPMLHLVNGLDKNTTHLMRLLDQLLEFRKLQNNKQKLNLQKVDAVSFLKEIFISFSDVAARTNVEYEFLPSQVSIPVYLDRNKVDKIVFNLLSNAFKFTPRGGKIMLIAEADNETKLLRIAVADNGIGIPKEKQHLLFSRFMQINFSASGTGIGLSLVNEFTSLHKGAVHFSENEGGGSVFTVELPLDEKVYHKEDFVNELVVVTREDKKEAVNLSGFIKNDGEALLNLLPNSPSAETKYKVLVIDDNDDIRDFLNDNLCPYFEIITAEDGNTGIQRSTAENPDLIICDVMMPGMNGFDLTRKLKENFETCHIPVILLTAYIADKHNSEGIEAGADAYITKPFSMSHLLLQINKLLEKRELLCKHYAANIPTQQEPDFTAMVPDKDKQFLELIEALMEKNMDNPELNVDIFAQMAKMSRTLFYTKVKALTGISPNEFIRTRRMAKAARLLASKEYNVSEVAYRVGINDPFYFSRSFKAHYGCSPSRFPEDYRKEEL